MKNKEIERKFLVDVSTMPNITMVNYMDITQGYIPNLSKDYVFRLRHVLHMGSDKMILGEDFYQTIKGQGGVIRDEFEIRLMLQQFYVLWPLCDKLCLHKHRFDLSHQMPDGDKVHYHLDKYLHELAGFYTVEVEFQTMEDCDNFVIPSWFGREVTDVKGYSNYDLAINKRLP